MVNHMNKKKINILGVVIIFLLGFLIHNLYDWFPSFVTIVISPVSESLFEHLKMIYTSYLIWTIIKHFLYKKFNLKSNNFLFNELITTLFEILIFYLIYLPIYNYFGENLILTLIIYFITIIISQVFNYLFELKKDYNFLKYFSLISIIFIYSTLTYLSYKPPICDFFLDSTNNSYGLNK